MEQLVIQVTDKEKAKLLYEILSALDFVNAIKSTELVSNELQPSSQEQPEDFFSCAGLWAGSPCTWTRTRISS